MAENRLWSVCYSGGPLASVKELLRKTQDFLLLTGGQGAPHKEDVILVFSRLCSGKGGVQDGAFGGALLDGRAAADVFFCSI